MNEYKDTWSKFYVGNCDNIPAWSTEKCKEFARISYKKLTIVSVFGTAGLCTMHMAPIVSYHFRVETTINQLQE